MTSLLDEYHAWSAGTKIELVNGQLVVGDCLSHSLRLLSQILRGWGIQAIVALAPELLWWQALSQTFDAPTVTTLDGMGADAMQQWADAVAYEPDIPLHAGRWKWSYSQLRQALRMALFGLGMRDEKLGQSLGGRFVNRLGNHGFMSDILFFRGEPRNRLYEYYLDGAADIVVEFTQPGCEDYIYTVKKPIYEATGVPELWIFDATQRQIELLRLIEGAYQLQFPDTSGRYADYEAVRDVKGVSAVFLQGVSNG